MRPDSGRPLSISSILHSVSQATQSKCCNLLPINRHPIKWGRVNGSGAPLYYNWGRVSFRPLRRLLVRPIPRFPQFGGAREFHVLSTTHGILSIPTITHLFWFHRHWGVEGEFEGLRRVVRYIRRWTSQWRRFQQAIPPPFLLMIK